MAKYVQTGVRLFLKRNFKRKRQTPVVTHYLPRTKPSSKKAAVIISTQKVRRQGCLEKQKANQLYLPIFKRMGGFPSKKQKQTAFAFIPNTSVLISNLAFHTQCSWIFCWMLKYRQIIQSHQIISFSDGMQRFLIFQFNQAGSAM